MGQLLAIFRSKTIIRALNFQHIELRILYQIYIINMFKVLWMQHQCHLVHVPVQPNQEISKDWLPISDGIKLTEIVKSKAILEMCYASSHWSQDLLIVPFLYTFQRKFERVEFNPRLVETYERQYLQSLNSDISTMVMKQFMTKQNSKLLIFLIFFIYFMFFIISIHKCSLFW